MCPPAPWFSSDIIDWKSCNVTARCMAAVVNNIQVFIVMVDDRSMLPSLRMFDAFSSKLNPGVVSWSELQVRPELAVISFTLGDRSCTLLVAVVELFELTESMSKISLSRNIFGPMFTAISKVVEV